MRHPKRMLAAIERVLPGLTAREWGSLAIEAARQAGLCEPDVGSLRANLENEWALRRPQRARTASMVPSTVRLRPRGGAA